MRRPVVLISSYILCNLSHAPLFIPSHLGVSLCFIDSRRDVYIYIIIVVRQGRLFFCLVMIPWKVCQEKTPLACNLLRSTVCGIVVLYLCLAIVSEYREKEKYCVGPIWSPVYLCSKRQHKRICEKFFFFCAIECKLLARRLTQKTPKGDWASERMRAENNYGCTRVWERDSLHGNRDGREETLYSGTVRETPRFVFIPFPSAITSYTDLFTVCTSERFVFYALISSKSHEQEKQRQNEIWIYERNKKK